MAAAVMGAGVATMTAYSTGTTIIMRSDGTTSSRRTVLPTSRGLRLSLGSPSARRFAAAATRAPQRRHKGVVCEASETAVGGATRVDPGLTGVVNDKDFKKLVLESDVPVLVDFWAPWCGPCRMIAPIIDELAKEYAGKLKCLKLNTDESPSIATEYGIRSIPTVMIFKGGKKQDTVIGAVPKSTLSATVEKYLD